MVSSTRLMVALVLLFLFFDREVKPKSSNPPIDMTPYLLRQEEPGARDAQVGRPALRERKCLLRKQNRSTRLLSNWNSNPASSDDPFRLCQGF